MPQSILIAIGGGGATHGTHPELDRLCLEHSGGRGRIGYIGTANRDDPERFQSFRQAFLPKAASVSCLSLSANRDQARSWVNDLDLIYVAGGNPVLLVDHWRAQGIDTVLHAAFQNGVTLAGVSAGAMCWFEHFLWRTPEDGFQISEGLGLVAGAMTPHSLIEPERRAHVRTLVTKGALGQTYAVDDGAALVLRDGALGVFPAAGPPYAYRIRKSDGEVVLNP